MLDERGRISFASELLDTVDAFLDEYQARDGRLPSDLQRGLVISYVLGVLRCDLETLWDCLGEADVFGALHPRAIFEECACDAPGEATRTAEMREKLARRGWFSMGSAGQ